MQTTITLEQAAHTLKVHPMTARKLAASGELPGAKIGRRWVFVESDLIDWLRSRYSNPVKAAPTGAEKCCTNEVQSIGQDSPAQTERKYAEALARKTGRGRKNGTTGLKLVYGTKNG